MPSTTFHIRELCCIDEELCIRKKFRHLEGIGELKFDVVSRRLIVDHSCPTSDLTDALRALGFSYRLQPGDDAPLSFWARHKHLLTTLISGALLAAGLVIHYAEISEITARAVLTGSILSGGWRIAARALRSLREKLFDMNVLMTAAVIGAMAIDRFEEGAAVIFFFAVSNLIERYSLDTSKRRIHALMSLSPAMATLVRADGEHIVDVGSIGVGDLLRIRPGERIPLDGKVVAGESTVNQAPVTGESRSKMKSVGDDVFAGSLNERGLLEIQVTHPHDNTTLARIVRKVEEALTNRPRIQTLGEAFAKYYTPAVLVMSLAVMVIPPVLLQEPFGGWFYRALVLLVIACPCALVISTPVTVVSALANAARHGILIKGGRHLEAMARIRAIAFDKTGTLTSGVPQVTDIVPLNTLSEKEILHLAAMLERSSEHPLAAGIIERADQQGRQPVSAAFGHFEELAGRGVHAKVDGKSYFIGNHALVEEKKLCSPEVERILFELERQGKTTIVVTDEHAPLGIIALKDTLKEEGEGIAKLLHNQGVKKVIMLTGDNEETARTLADRAGIDEVHANLLPDEKLNCVGKLMREYNSVAMVGDGINDAPALAASTVGIAMGTTGTDIAMETADIVLMSDDLSKLPYTIALSRKTLSIIKQNISIALVTKLSFVILAILGKASLWMAVLADDGAALLVILNGLRVLRPRGAQLKVGERRSGGEGTS